MPDPVEWFYEPVLWNQQKDHCSHWFPTRITEMPHLVGGFECILFSALLLEIIQFDWYFSDGLKPPTSHLSLIPSIFSFSNGMMLSHFEPTQAELADAPWRGPMSNQSDFFNFNLTEDEFKDWKESIQGETNPFLVGCFFFPPKKRQLWYDMFDMCVSFFSPKKIMRWHSKKLMFHTWLQTCLLVMFWDFASAGDCQEINTSALWSALDERLSEAKNSSNVATFDLISFTKTKVCLLNVCSLYPFFFASLFLLSCFSVISFWPSTFLQCPTQARRRRKEGRDRTSTWRRCQCGGGKKCPKHEIPKGNGLADVKTKTPCERDVWQSQLKKGNGSLLRWFRTGGGTKLT